MSKFLGFLLGVAVALAGPAVFGVLAAPGGIELNTKGMALAYGIGALIFWTVVSYFSGAGALGAFAAFGTLVYCWLWIPNRTTNFLNDVPGVTTGMIEGSEQYTLNGVVPILTVISLVYAIQLIVHSVQRRRRERAEAERLQREQEVAQAQQEADAAAVYPVAGSTYPAGGGGYGGTHGSSTRYDDLFDEDPEPVRPRNQAEDQTAQYPVSAPEHTAQFPSSDARSNESGDDTVLVPTDRDETTQVPVENQPAAEEPTEAQQPDRTRPVAAAPQQPVAAADDQPTVAAPAPAPKAGDEQTAVAPVATEKPGADAPQEQPGSPQPEAQAPQEQPVAAPAPTPKAEPKAEAEEPNQPGAKSEAGPVGNEQMGQQYRERMEDPEDTGELYISAFEPPPQVSIRPAGA
ncbi:hypothetical protein E1218_12960 [Kribbella turkmenica]|uniref:Uncharacterized protein n=1 Tax=Kribbella turkmenica TaxID=2530375 RepID=A0A4R4X7U0_9ACTN|nr:hypothetical protein [Kribbella turkmenica]TDD26520.1 hypothetical protein E1218_12960 [Kribbella turkmenica]